MNGYKYLLKNVGLLTVSSFATKFLSFFLVPLYTNVLTTEEYGIFDLFNTTIGILVPILTQNIQEAVMRFTLDKTYNRQAIIAVSTKMLLISSGAVFVGLFANNVFTLNVLVEKYSIFIFLMFFLQALSGIVISYVRGIDKIKELSISSVLSSAIIISCNILFLLVFKWGLIGYFWANIIGPALQCIYLIVCASIPKNLCIKKSFLKEQKELLAYSRPMVANSIAWWVNNASDRYIVILFCGLAENGIYSVASKIPSILNMFQTIFNQAWALSAVKDYDPEDSTGFFSNTYKAYNCFMVVLCAAIILADKMLAKYLYANDFYIAWRYVPWLTIAILFGALSGYLGGFFSAVKNSKTYAQSTIVGALVNVILNLLFTPFLGALGAAVATTICYFVVWAIRYQSVKNYIKLKVNIVMDLFSYSLLIVQSLVVLVIANPVYMYLVELLLFVLILLVNKVEILKILNRMLKNINHDLR